MDKWVPKQWSAKRREQQKDVAESTKKANVIICSTITGVNCIISIHVLSLIWSNLPSRKIEIIYVFIKKLKTEVINDGWKSLRIRRIIRSKRSPTWMGRESALFCIDRMTKLLQVLYSWCLCGLTMASSNCTIRPRHLDEIMSRQTVDQTLAILLEITISSASWLLNT